jgi:hypothetical protein
MSQGKSMKREAVRTFASTVFVLGLVLSAAWPGQAQGAKSLYPSMAPVDQYLMERNAEIALAQSAAPKSISRDAEVMVLGRHGYETAVKGKNGFACIVDRSWTMDIDDPQFWNPKLRAPICFNPAAVRSYLPLTLKKTELILAGQSKAQMSEAIKAALDRKQLPTPESGAMCYMMSKKGYLSDDVGHWHPHLMFFVPQTDGVTWGADLPGSPVVAANDTQDRLTVFMVLVSKWSDGTGDPTDNY